MSIINAMMAEDLDDSFQHAADYLGHLASSKSGQVDQDVLLKFYGYYKQATVGPCNTSKPGFWNQEGARKWQAWSALGSLSQDDAKQQYIYLLDHVAPNWQEAPEDEAAASTSGSNKKSMGPVFSSFAYESGENEQSDDDEAKRLQLHDATANGCVEAAKKLVAEGADVNAVNQDGCTPLHLAADRGFPLLVRILVEAGADVNRQDSEGQTALHYAAICEFDQVCQQLLEAGADPSLKDLSGQAPHQVGPDSWDFWPATKQDEQQHDS